MELGLYPKRQRWYIERFILHGWPWGENSSQITPEPKGPPGLSIWGKLLLVASYEDICHVTGLGRATDHYRLDCMGFTWRTSHRKVLPCEAHMREEKLQYIDLHADAFSLLSVLSDPISSRRHTRPEGALILLVQYVCVNERAAFFVDTIPTCMCVNAWGWSIQLEAISQIRTARASVGIRFSEVLGLPSNIFYSTLLFTGRAERGMGGGGVKEEGRNMIYPSRYLMNLLWVAKLFMSLIAKFLHASLPFLASEPKSNSARRNTHTSAYPYAYTYLTQSRWNLHTQRAHARIHTRLHDD